MNKRLDNVLLQGKALMDDAGLPFVLVCGTLLGIKREGSLLEHDKDVDVGVLAEDITDEIKKKIKGYKQFGAESSSASKHGQLSFVFDKINFDIFPMYLKGKRRYCNLAEKTGMWWPSHHFEKPWPRIKYLEIDWFIPRDWKGFLTQQYGDWQEVVKDFVWNKDSLNYKEKIL